VGDSITETGYWSGNMQGLLPDDRFIVKGCGKGGTTAMSTGRWSADNAGSAAYKNHTPYTRSLSSNPDVVVIMFGINDAYSFNWDQAGNANGAQFKKDYIALIRTYQNLASHPTVIMAIPPTVYSTYANCKENLEGKVIPVLREIAAETGVTLVDVQTATAGHRDHFADGVHPSDDTGRLLIATPIANAVLAHVEGE
jgi:lysophospholipase L1-like esterase